MDPNQLEDEILNYLEERFQKAHLIVDAELEFIETNRLIEPKENYFLTLEFLLKTMQQITRIDPKSLSSMLLKLSKNIAFLQSEYKKIKALDPQKLFSNEFTLFSPTLKQLLQDSLAQNGDEKKELLALRKELKLYCYEKFKTHFEEHREELARLFMYILNSKALYFDRLLWEDAKKSKLLVHYFATNFNVKLLGSKSYIEGVLNMLRTNTQEYEYLLLCQRVYK